MAKKIRLDASAATQIRQVAAVNAAARADHSVSGTLAWILVVVLGGALGVILLFNHQEMSARQQEHQARVLAVQEQSSTLERETKIKTDSLKAAFDEVARKFEPLSKQVARLETEVQQARVTHAVLNQETMALKAAAPVVPAAPAAMVQETPTAALSQADKLTAKASALAKQRAQLVSQYKERFAEVKKDFDGAMLREDPERIKHLFVRFRRSPFAPAAAFFAGEKLLFEKNDFNNAKVHFSYVIKDFPDSYYAKYAAIRLDELNGKLQEEYENIAYKDNRNRDDDPRNNNNNNNNNTSNQRDHERTNRPVAPSGYVVKNKGNRTEKWYKVYKLDFVPYNVPEFAK